jgi:ATP-dependent Clp protease protease subunit
MKGFKMENCDSKTEAPATPNAKIQEFFLSNRKLFLTSAIDEKVADDIVQKMIYLDSLNNEDIILFINSPGGVISAGMAILDAMDAVKSDVVTVVIGQAASMAAVTLACGAKGKRYAWPRSRVMIHQPLISGSFRATVAEIQTEAEEITRMKDELNQILSEKTGQPLEKVVSNTDRDFWMVSSKALDYGMVDKIETLI